MSTFYHMSTFYVCCNDGYLDEAKRLYNLNDNDINYEKAFIGSCENGRLDVAKWLWSLADKSSQNINIHANNEEAFIKSCINGRKLRFL